MNYPVSFMLRLSAIYHINISEFYCIRICIFIPVLPSRNVLKHVMCQIDYNERTSEKLPAVLKYNIFAFVVPTTKSFTTNGGASRVELEGN